MTKVFLKEMWNKETIRNYLLLGVLFFAGFSYLLENNTTFSQWKLGLPFLYLIAFAIFAATYSFLKSHAGGGQLLPYYAYPFPRASVNASFVHAVLLDTIVKKLSFVVIFLYLVHAHPSMYAYVFFCSVQVCLLAVLLHTKHMDTLRKTLLFILGLLILVSPLFIKEMLTKDHTTLAAVAIYAGLSLGYYLLIRRLVFERAFIDSENHASLAFAHTGNYFLTFILSENIYLLNSIGIIGFMIFISVVIPEPLNKPLALTMATVNSPLLSIFSTEPGLKHYDDMLPSRYTSLSKQYLWVLAVYFVLINGLVVALHSRSLDGKFLGVALIVTIVDIALSFFLEKKVPIKDKKTDMAVWKSPRKYLLPVLVFSISFVGLILV